MAIFGVLSAGAGSVVLARAGAVVLALGFAGVALLAVVNAAWVVALIRQGPHYQPGPGVPPYEPLPSSFADELTPLGLEVPSDASALTCCRASTTGGRPCEAQCAASRSAR